MKRLTWFFVAVLGAAIVSLSAQQAGPIIIPGPFSGGGSFSAPLLAPDGTCAATPSYSYAAEPTLGMTRVASGVIGTCSGGSERLRQYVGGIVLMISGELQWSNSGDSSSPVDTAITRGAASRIDTGAGDSFSVPGGYLSVGGVPATPLTGSYFSTGVAFAGLGAPTNGTFIFCSDCTIASPCAGAGTGALAKRLNGTWVCN